MTTATKAALRRRPASWVKAETQGHTWNGEIISIYRRPLEYASLAIGLEAEAGDPWFSGATRVASMLATVAVTFVAWVVTAMGQGPAPASVGSLVTVLMR